jgi:DNA-binding NarL/FixJ family response regulator
MMIEPATIRTVLADDHELMRCGLKLLLERVPGVVVVAEVGRADDLLDALRCHAPDLVVTDLSMPGMEGLMAWVRLRAPSEPPRVLIVSQHDSPELIRRSRELGADGYLGKNESPQELERAVRSVMAGRVYRSPSLSQNESKLIERPPQELLTERQLEILVRIGRGDTTKEIAFELGLSPKTVDVHRARVMERLGVDDIARLTLYCVRHGLVDARCVTSSQTGRRMAYAPQASSRYIEVS